MILLLRGEEGESADDMPEGYGKSGDQESGVGPLKSISKMAKTEDLGDFKCQKRR